MLEAIVVGVETECRLGALIGAQHYVVGFHSTGTLGTFGAAAACAHMLNLDEDGWLHALGLAGTQAAGLKSGFGTMAKPLHAGRAASNGLFSALAARGGYTSNPAILETERDFSRRMRAPKPNAEVLGSLAGKFLIRDNLFKYHASCYLTHAPINAAQLIRSEHRIDPNVIDAVEVRVHPSLVQHLQYPGAEDRARRKVQPARDHRDGAAGRRHQRPRDLQRCEGHGARGRFACAIESTSSPRARRVRRRRWCRSSRTETPSRRNLIPESLRSILRCSATT